MKVIDNKHNYEQKLDNELGVMDIHSHIGGMPELENVSIHLKNEMANEWTKAMEELEGHILRLKQLGAPADIIRTLIPLGGCFPLNK